MNTTPIPSVEAFLQMLPDIVRWQLRGANVVCLVHCPQAGGWSCHHIGLGELDTIHPDLPATLVRITKAENAHNPAVEVSGGLLQAQVKTLLDPLEVPCRVGGRYYVLQFKTFFWEPAHSFARVGALTYWLQTPTTVLYWEPVPPVVKEVRYSLLNVPVDWLNTQYPGWAERHTTACALECSADDLVTHVLSHPKSGSTPSLPSADFTSAV